MNQSLSGAETILRTCAGLSEEETLLIATDSSADSRAVELYSSSKKMNVDVTVGEIKGPVTREPPDDIAKQMLENDVTIFCVNEPRTLLWGHADAKVAAISRGKRILFLTQPIESTPDPEQLLRIRERSFKLADILESAESVTLITRNAGNEPERLDLKLAKRKALRLSSILSRPGSWGAVPDYAEAGVAPLETGTNGRLIVDGIIVGLGKVKSPVELEFQDGRLVRIKGGKTGQDFDRLLGSDPSSRVLCELGFGTNHLRTEVKGEFDDKKALGSVHIALGDNHTFGGTNRSNIHVDALVVRPEVLIDGKPFDLMSI